MARADDSYINEILALEPLLRAFLHRFVPRPTDLEDVLQDTYARLLAVPDPDRAMLRSAQAFALTTARNIAIDWMRRSRTVPFDLIEDLDSMPAAGDGSAVEDIVNTHQQLTRLAEAVADLPDRCAEVFTLRKVYGFSQQEISAYFGISISTVEQHLVKAVKRCKQHSELLDVSRRQGKPASRWPWKRGQA